VVKAWQTSLVVSDADVGILNFADDAEQAFKIIDTKSNGVLL